MKNIKLNTQINLIKLRLLHEIDERQYQDAMAARSIPYDHQDVENNEAPVEEDEESDIGEQELEAPAETPIETIKQQQTPDYDMVKKQLNIIRGGHSFDDKKVRPQITKFFNELSTAEKLALYSFLDAFAKMVSSGEEAKSVQEPSDAPFNVVMNIKKTSNLEDEESGESNADTDKEYPKISSVQDAPIVVGESQGGKHTLKEIIKRNNRG